MAAVGLPKERLRRPDMGPRIHRPSPLERPPRMSADVALGTRSPLTSDPLRYREPKPGWLARTAARPAKVPAWPGPSTVESFTIWSGRNRPRSSRRSSGCQTSPWARSAASTTSPSRPLAGGRRRVLARRFGLHPCHAQRRGFPIRLLSPAVKLGSSRPDRAGSGGGARSRLQRFCILGYARERHRCPHRRQVAEEQARVAGLPRRG